jgi:hypothetical protein
MLKLFVWSSKLSVRALAAVVGIATASIYGAGLLVAAGCDENATTADIPQAKFIAIDETNAYVRCNAEGVPAPYSSEGGRIDDGAITPITYCESTGVRVDFGQVAAGVRRTVRIGLGNAGALAYVVTAVDLAIDGPSAFSVTQLPADSILPETSGILGITFEPTAAMAKPGGLFKAKLRVVPRSQLNGAPGDRVYEEGSAILSLEATVPESFDEDTTGGDSTDTGDGTDTTDTGDTGDTGETGETEDTGDDTDTGETEDTGDTTDTGETEDTGDTTDTGETDDTGDTEGETAG